MYKLSLFGGFSLSNDDQGIQIPSAKQRCILAWLAVHSPGRSTRDQIAEKFWGWREPGRSRQSLRTALSALRRQLDDASVLDASGDELWLNFDNLEVDLVEFQKLSHAQDEVSLRDAGQLYKGDFLAGMIAGENEIDNWIGGVRETFRTRALEIFVSLSGKRAAIGRFDQAIAYARRAVEIDELSEDAQRALISNLIAANRRADAARQAKSFMQLFESELSTVPSSETLALVNSLQVATIAQPAPGPTHYASGSGPHPTEGFEAPEIKVTPHAKTGLVERRPITALAYDLSGLDAVSGAAGSLEAIAETFSLIGSKIRAVADEWYGTLEATEYDAGVIIFGDSENTENQYDDAVEAALDLSKAIAELRSPEFAEGSLDIGITIDTAASLIRTGEDGAAELVFSPSVMLARRLNRSRTEGGIALTTRVKDRLAGSFDLKHVPAGEKGEPEDYWLVEKRGRNRTRFMARARALLPIVDRKRELEILTSRWRDLTVSGGQVVVLRGDPGIGKSRLLHEFQARLRAEKARAVCLQCSPEGASIALSPLVNLFRRRNRSREENLRFLRRILRRLGLDSVSETDQLGIALGFDTGEENLSASNQREANRRVSRSLELLLEAVSASGPLCVQVEDAHWADASTIAQLQHLAEWIRDRPILFVLTSRLDSLQAVSDEVNVTNLLVRKLDWNDSRKLASTIWESMTDESINPTIAEKISGYGDGVPLFLEELVYWYRRRAQKSELDLAIGADWINESPPVAELLMSRLNALAASKAVAQVASVIGETFDEALLAGVCSQVAGIPDVERSLRVLIDNSIIRQTWPEPAAEYQFRHIMLREAAYGSLREADRKFVHGKIYARLREEADAGNSVSLIDLALHAEACGETEAAATTLLQAGRETAQRMALAEATQLLSKALDVSDGVDVFERRQHLQLSIISSLGPLLTSQFGPRDPRSSAIYNRGVGLARRLPPQDRIDWYAIFWGWWYTGKDFREMHDRAIRVQEMLGTIDDPEIVLQTNHCIWAIDFNIGHHQSALQAIERGLAHYREGSEDGVVQYGGHDAKVCGLGQKALLLWLTGRVEDSDTALQEMADYVARLNHVPSTAHSMDTEVVSAFYRDDFARILEVCGKMDALAKAHDLHVLGGLSNLFGGWAVAHTGNARDGMKRFLLGLETMENLGSAGDLPLYLYMHATMLQRSGNPGPAMEIIERSIAAAEESGHSYWLAELYRRRAALRASLGGDPATIVSDLESALSIADDQQAKSLEARVRETARKLLPDHAL